MPRIRPSPSGRALDYFTYALAALSQPSTLWVDQSTRVAAEDRNTRFATV